jgi:hypothetical protein
MVTDRRYRYMEILIRAVSILTRMVSCQSKWQNQTMAKAICRPRSFQSRSVPRSGRSKTAEVYW